MSINIVIPDAHGHLLTFCNNQSCKFTQPTCVELGDGLVQFARVNRAWQVCDTHFLVCGEEEALGYMACTRDFQKDLRGGRGGVFSNPCGIFRAVLN